MRWLNRTPVRRTRSRRRKAAEIAVITATIVVVAATTVFVGPQLEDPLNLAIVIMAAAGLAAVGAMDDLRPMEAVPRLLLQTAASIAVVATLPPEMSVVPIVPWWLDRTIMVVGGDLARQRRELHGRHRLDDGGGDCPGNGRSRRIRSDRRTSPISDHCGRCALRRRRRLCAVKQSNRPIVSRRCRQPADRTVARLDARATCGTRPFVVRDPAATLLSWQTRPPP